MMLFHRWWQREVFGSVLPLQPRAAGFQEGSFVILMFGCHSWSSQFRTSALCYRSLLADYTQKQYASE